MKRLFHFLSLSFIFMLSSMAVCGCVPAQTPLYYFHAGLSTYHELLDDVLGKRSEVDLFSSAADSSAPVSSVTETISCAPLYADYSYYLPSLADDEAANFQALYTGIQGFQSTISLPVAVSSDNVSDLMHLLTNECPELMQLSSRWVEHSNLLGLVVSVSPEYTISKETFDAQTAAVNTLIQSWQTTLSGQSAYQAELTIYNYIIENCVYSTQADNCQSAYGALIDGQAKCDGRAKALVWGLRSLGIKSSVITGNTHAWVMKMTAFSSLYVTHILIFQNQLSHLIHTRQMIFTKDEATLPLCAGTLIFMFRPVYGFMLMTLRQVTLLLVPRLTVQEHSLSRRQKASGKAAVKVL